MDPAADKPIHFSSIFFPPRRVFGAKLSTHMVYISTAKRIKQSEKPISTFQKKSKFFCGGWGPPTGGLWRTALYVYTVPIFEDTV